MRTGSTSQWHGCATTTATRQRRDGGYELHEQSGWPEGVGHPRRGRLPVPSRPRRPSPVMALLTAVLGGGPLAMLCSAAPDASPLTGMIPMYLLMSAFHTTPLAEADLASAAMSEGTLLSLLGARHSTLRGAHAVLPTTKTRRSVARPARQGPSPPLARRRGPLSEMRESREGPTQLKDLTRPAPAPAGFSSGKARSPSAPCPPAATTVRARGSVPRRRAPRRSGRALGQQREVEVGVA